MASVNTAKRPVTQMPSPYPLIPFKRPVVDTITKKRKLTWREVAANVLPESPAYQELVSMEKKIDACIANRRLEIYDALQNPHKVRRKLRVFLSTLFYPNRADLAGDSPENVPMWEMRIEGRLVEDETTSKFDSTKFKHKFSSFFKTIIVELDGQLYGPDDHLIEWHRTPATVTETDGFQFRRTGDRQVPCTVILVPDHRPPHFKLDPRLARLLGLHTASKAAILAALWTYIKEKGLLDSDKRDLIICDKYLRQILSCRHIKLSDLPHVVRPYLLPADPVVLNHVITVDGLDRRTVCYDLDVSIDEYQNRPNFSGPFMMSTSQLQEVASLEAHMADIMSVIGRMRHSRDTLLRFADTPDKYIGDYVVRQSKDIGLRDGSENDRFVDFFNDTIFEDGFAHYSSVKIEELKAELGEIFDYQL